jgi:hypothetical protein
MEPGGQAEHGWVVQNRVGRLVEARVFGLRTREEVDAYSREIGIILMRTPKDVRPILCADHRPVVTYSPAVVDRLVEIFQQLNDRLERVAIIVARSNATLVAQLQQMVKKADLPNRAARKVVHTADDADAHLAPVCQPDELSRMRDFLDDWAGAPSLRIRI